MTEFNTQAAMDHVRQLTAAEYPERPLLLPTTSDGGVWDRLQGVMDEYGELGDIETDRGIVRKVSFAYPHQLGLMRIQEIPNPRDLTGDLAYHVLRVDHRGEVEVLIAREERLGKQAIDAIHWDLDLYASAEQAELHQKRTTSAVSWLIQPLLLLNTMRPSLKRHRAFDQTQQYEEKPIKVAPQTDRQIRVSANTDDDARYPKTIAIGGGSIRREKPLPKSMRAMLLRMGASHDEIRYVFKPARRRK